MTRFPFVPPPLPVSQPRVLPRQLSEGAVEGVFTGWGPKA